MSPLALLLAAALAAPDQGCLLVTVSRNGERWAIGPAFHLPGPCRAPAGGALALEGLDRAGRALLRAPFDVAPMADGGGAGGAGAALLVPLAPARRDRLETLRVRQGERVLAQRSREAPPGRAQAAARRAGPDGLRLTWNGRSYPYALVRDASTREVIASGERGEATVVSRAGRIELLLSDGVRGRRVLLRVR